MSLLDRSPAKCVKTTPVSQLDPNKSKKHKIDQTDDSTTKNNLLSNYFFSIPSTGNSSRTNTNTGAPTPHPAPPTKTDMSVRELADLILPSIKQLACDVSQIKGHLGIMEERITSLEATVNSQQKQIESLSRERDFLIDEMRKPNLLIHGLPEMEDGFNDHELKDTITAILQDHLGIKTTVDNPYRLGKPAPGKTRPVKFRLTLLSDRAAVLKNRKRLISLKTGFSITEDLSLTTRLARKKAWEKRNPQHFTAPNTGTNTMEYD